MSDTDQELIARYTREHAEDAFAELVRRHINLVHSAALRQVSSPQLAEEVAQSTFIKLARHAQQLAPDAIVTAWLYQVTRREAIDVVRREARRQLREQIAIEMNAMNATANAWTSIEPLLDEAMHALDETDRVAILLRYFENKSLREVGQSLGATDDAAQKRVSRAVERLREFFAKRGVTVGAGGLVVVISANAVQAAPVGLAATISTTAAALIGTAIASATSATITQTIAMTTVQKTLITAAIAASIVTPLVIQHQAQVKLRQSNLSLHQQIDQLAGQNDRLSNLLVVAESSEKLATDQAGDLLRLRGEVGSLRQRTNELARLEADNQRLRSLATASTRPGNLAQATTAQESSPKESWAFVGYGDPESAFQSAVWAMSQGDAKILFASLAPDGRESRKLENMSEEEMVKKRKEQFDKVTGFRIIDKEVVSDDEVILAIFLEGTKEADRFKLQRVGNNWKLDGPYREKRSTPAAQ